MYKLDIFDNINVKPDYYILYYGIKNKIIEEESAADYVCRKMENDEPVSEEEVMLTWGTEDVLEILEGLIESSSDQSNISNNVMPIIRLAVIVYERANEKNINRLLEKTDMLYADFGYPLDMESFVTYMPLPDYDASKHTLEENQKHLLDNLDKFIEKQKKVLKCG